MSFEPPEPTQEDAERELEFEKKLRASQGWGSTLHYMRPELVAERRVRRAREWRERVEDQRRRNAETLERTKRVMGDFPWDGGPATPLLRSLGERSDHSDPYAFEYDAKAGKEIVDRYGMVWKVAVEKVVCRTGPVTVALVLWSFLCMAAMAVGTPLWGGPLSVSLVTGPLAVYMAVWLALFPAFRRGFLASWRSFGWPWRLLVGVPLGLAVGMVVEWRSAGRRKAIDRIPELERDLGL